MSNIIKFTIDGETCMAERGIYILQAAHQNGFYIPTLCNLDGVKPRGSCRICSVKVNGKIMTACTTPVADGMQIENNNKELNEIRKAIVELLLVEGNHYCPFCEKSGNCELQALGYRFHISAPRYPYQFPERDIEASNHLLIKDHNRCILCKRCIRSIKDDKGRSIFAFKKRGHKVVINIDTRLASEMDDDMAQKAMDICPVGAILKKEVGFKMPIGERLYDRKPIGNEFEKSESATF
jgi:[NiFe] hydrogenase diaphorase moiety small subunit